MLKEKIFWHDTVAMPEAGPLEPLPTQVDVAIVGAGYTGLSVARSLAARGARVAVLEAETPGWGASSRNGGMVLTGLKRSMQSIDRQYGRDTAIRLFRSSLAAIDLVEQIVRDEAIQCGFARRGHLVAASKPGHYAALAEEAEFMGTVFNHTLRLVPRSAQQAEVGSTAYYGALVDDTSAGLNPAQYVAGLARAARRAGAGLYSQARVQRLERGAAGFSLETERGRLRAEKVLVATSGYTRRATPRLQRRIIPIGSFIIATEQLSEELAREISPQNRMIFNSLHYLNYFRLWDRRLIFGGRAAFFPDNANTVRSSADILRREMIQVFPQLSAVQIEYAWGGTLDFAFDMMTHVGELDGLYYSLGYAGHGVAMATYLGQTVGEAMWNGNIREHPFAEFPFPGAPLGLYNGFPWFLPFAGLWHKVLDWVQ